MSPSGIDGIWGPGTKAAVKNFQMKNSLSNDGVVGPTTWKYLATKGKAQTISMRSSAVSISATPKKEDRNKLADEVWGQFVTSGFVKPKIRKALKKKGFTINEVVVPCDVKGKKIIGFMFTSDTTVDLLVSK